MMNPKQESAAFPDYCVQVAIFNDRLTSSPLCRGTDQASDFCALDFSQAAARQHPPVAADDHDLEFAPRAGEHPGGGPPRAIRDKGGQVEARGFRAFERLEPAVGFSDRLGEIARP